MSLVVAPYTAMHPQTAAALDEHAPGHVRIAVADEADPGWDYCALLERLWANTETFTLVEHDIVITADVLPAFEACPSWWCGFLYPVQVVILSALGCTRFRAELLAAEPDVMQKVAAIGGDGLPVRDWRRLDVRLGDELIRRGYRRCVHTPEVEHLHDYAESFRVW